MKRAEYGDDKQEGGDRVNSGQVDVRLHVLILPFQGGEFNLFGQINFDWFVIGIDIYPHKIVFTISG